jgi:DNA-directed RNA polymerase specialized sigma subunit
MYLLGVEPAAANIVSPFCELGKTIFWRLLTKSSEASGNSGRHVATIDEFKERYHGVRLAEDLYTILQMEHLRNKLGNILIATYFEDETARNIAEQSEINRTRYSKNTAAQD